jgi:hypothetical protein
MRVLAAVVLTAKAIQGSPKHRNILGNDKTIKMSIGPHMLYVNSVLILLHIHAI